MHNTIWIFDIEEIGAIEIAKEFLAKGNNIIFSEDIGRERASKIIEKLLPFARGSAEICFYNADIENQSEFEKIKLFVTQNFGDYCILKNLKGNSDEDDYHERD